MTAASVEDLFESTRHKTGIRFEDYDEVLVEVVPNDIPPVKHFSELALHPALQANIDRCGYDRPTPVQKHGIPVCLQKNDLMACAQTGSGKTAAFLLPIAHDVLVNGAPPVRQQVCFPVALILAPTRELAIQIYDESRKFLFTTAYKSTVIYGGVEFAPQFADLAKGSAVVVGTPGRLKDIYQKSRLGFEFVRFLVLDEADRMLDMGFEEQIEFLIAGRYSDMPPCDRRQTMMYSATFPRPIQVLARRYLKQSYYLLQVGRVGSTTKNIVQCVKWVEPEEKKDMLLALLHQQSTSDLVLVFVERKRDADILEQFLLKQGIPVTTIHGDRKQRDREEALAEFRSGQKPVLVATDVASRGLDIPNVAHVIQYDLPQMLDDYTHRIGRTARAGNTGCATSFCCADDRNIAADLATYLKDHDQEVPEWLTSFVVSSLAPKRGGRGSRGSGPPSGRGGRGRGGYSDEPPGGPRTSRGGKEPQRGRGGHAQKPSGPDFVSFSSGGL